MENNKRYIDQGDVTIITEIDPAKLESLKALLAKIGGNDIGGGIVNFEKMKTLHFGRWFLMTDARISDGKGGYSDENKFPDSLVFTSNFDGPVEEHLEDVVNSSKDAIIELYSHCKDFPEEDNISTEQVVSFLKKEMEANQLFWPAIRGGTVEQLKGESLLRSEIQSFLDASIKDGSIRGKKPEDIKKQIVEFVKGDDRLSWALTPRAKPTFGWKFKYYGTLVGKLIILLPVLLLLGIWALLVGIFNKRDNKYRKEIHRSSDFEALLKNEDRIFMNQLTVYGGLKRPYWFRTFQLRLGLWLFSLNGVYRSNKGKLSGIETIHFARWAVFNKGKNVMFLSNYDGAWEIYLSEFIDRSAAAMNLTFGTTLSYPKVKGLFGEGAHDEQAFKTVVRNNQYPCQVWYSAYPRLTVKNILNNKKIREGLCGTSKESVSDWLKRF